MSLSAFGRDYVLPKDLIVMLKRFRFLFTVGIRIVHTVPTYPRFMVFWDAFFWDRTVFAELKAAFESLGHEVRC
jgi:hypothetical protein